MLSDHNLSLFNTGSSTYFDAPSQSFTAIDLSVCFPSLFSHFSWRVDSNPLGSDHFPILLREPGRGQCHPTQVPQWKLDQAHWSTFTALAELDPAIINQPSIDDCVAAVTGYIIQAAAQCIPKISTGFPRYPRPWWNPACHLARKAQKRAWDTFRKYPTLSNRVAFQSQKESWIKFTTSISSTTSSKIIWDRIRKVNGHYHSVPLSILLYDGQEVADVRSIADTLGESFCRVSSTFACSSTFLAIKTRAERSPLSFRTDCFFDYNCPFTLVELKMALHQSASTSVEPDDVHYDMLHHLSPASLDVLLIVFNWIWQENVFLDAWYQAIILSFSKPGKDPKIPSNYRPIALTSHLASIKFGRRKLF
ncbi:uncharacterized protein LOC143252270 isoform X1 [Tachypleus tridentatus]|uniref:uncharacterized protein LOC143252270 isoform X1 n=1 Tax=Tachypleus tridentatus TaxID=6853 RepID=UPI003FD07016